MPTFVIANDSQSLAQALFETLHSDSEFYMLVPCSAEAIAKQLSAAETPQEESGTDHRISRFLQMLNLPPHRVGYRQLQYAIPLFTKDPKQSLSKELYPAVADVMCYGDWKSVEYSIRRAILYGWSHRDPLVWARLFPDEKKPPSNKTFISTLAAMLK